MAKQHFLQPIKRLCFQNEDSDVTFNGIIRQYFSTRGVLLLVHCWGVSKHWHLTMNVSKNEHLVVTEDFREKKKNTV